MVNLIYEVSVHDKTSKDSILLQVIIYHRNEQKKVDGNSH